MRSPLLNRRGGFLLLEEGADKMEYEENRMGNNSDGIFYHTDAIQLISTPKFYSLTLWKNLNKFKADIMSSMQAVDD